MPDSQVQAIIVELRGFRELFEERTNNIESTLSRVEEQTVRTNGRVTKCELELAETRGKAKISGILWGTLTAIGVSVVSFFINRQIQ